MPGKIKEKRIKDFEQGECYNCFQPHTLFKRFYKIESFTGVTQEVQVNPTFVCENKNCVLFQDRLLLMPNWRPAVC